MMVTNEVEAEALRIWRERELRLPGPGRRMTPDHWDEITGAWGRCLSEARESLTGKSRDVAQSSGGAGT